MWIAPDAIRGWRYKCLNNRKAVEYESFITKIQPLRGWRQATRFTPDCIRGYSHSTASRFYRTENTKKTLPDAIHIQPLRGFTAFWVAYRCLHSPNLPKILSEMGAPRSDNTFPGHFYKYLTSPRSFTLKNSGWLMLELQTSNLELYSCQYTLFTRSATLVNTS